jgi:hypothetical protein
VGQEQDTGRGAASVVGGGHGARVAGQDCWPSKEGHTGDA